MVRVTGLEPARISPLEPKSSVFANSTTPACRFLKFLNCNTKQMKLQVIMGKCLGYNEICLEYNKKMFMITGEVFGIY